MNNHMNVAAGQLPASIQALLDSAIAERDYAAAAAAAMERDRALTEWRQLAEVIRTTLPSELLPYISGELFHALEEEEPVAEWDADSKEAHVHIQLPKMRLISAVYAKAHGNTGQEWRLIYWVVSMPVGSTRRDTLKEALLTARTVWEAHGDTEIPF
jgi:hypothetical protein